MKIYSLYSKSLKRYNLPFFAEDDASAIDRVSKMVTSQADPSLMCALDDLQLRDVGTFNPNVETDGDPIWFSTGLNCLVMDNLYTDLPLPPTVKAQLDKFYGGKANG